MPTSHEYTRSASDRSPLSLTPSAGVNVQQLTDAVRIPLSGTRTRAASAVATSRMASIVCENAAFELVVADERLACLDTEIRRLEERLVDVLIEAQSYRVVAQQAIHALYRLTVDHYKLHQTHDKLVEEYRGFRERLLRDAGATP
jgi:hypothetical protein